MKSPAKAHQRPRGGSGAAQSTAGKHREYDCLCQLFSTLGLLVAGKASAGSAAERP